MGISQIDPKRQETLKHFAKEWSLSLTSEILNEATTHPSFKGISPQSKDYERLETLGDAVLDLLVIAWFIDHGLATAGALTEARSEAVNDTALAKIGADIGIDRIIQSAPSHPISKRMCADVIEAIFGALFTEKGLDECQTLLNALFLSRLEQILREKRKGIKRWGQAEKNYRNIIDDFFKQRNKTPPEFILEQERGPPHSKSFEYRCQVMHDGNLLIGRGEGTTKKDAKQKAAKSLCQRLGLLTDNNFQK
ncbi:MAG: ribonuclease III domain-containing protein [Candidatus Thorarchaeota archaeon]